MGFGEGTEHLLRIKRPDTCIRPSGEHVIFREGLLEVWPEEREEVTSTDACVSFRSPDKVIERLVVVIGQWAKDAYI